MRLHYREAAAAFWGPAGEYLYDRYTDYREAYFPALPPELPIVIGLTAYGHCHGLTATTWSRGPRITIESRLFGISTGRVDDVLLHEMLHAWLAVTCQDPAHDSAAWYQAVRHLSPVVLGHELPVERGAGRISKRVPNPEYAPGSGQPRTLVRKVRAEQAVTHAQVATWPGSLRPDGYYQPVTIPCPSY